MRFKCKNCGEEYGYFDLFYNGNGDGRRFISCDKCSAITIINIPDYFHGWNPNEDEIIIMEVLEDTFKELKLSKNQKKAIKWIDDEEEDFCGFYPFIENGDGSLVEYGVNYAAMFDETTFRKNVDFERCAKEMGVEVYWCGSKEKLMRLRNND